MMIFEGTNPTSETSAVTNTSQNDPQKSLSGAAAQDGSNVSGSCERHSDWLHERQMAAAVEGLAAANLHEAGKELEAEWKDVLLDYFCRPGTSTREVVESDSEDEDSDDSQGCEGESGDQDSDDDDDDDEEEEELGAFGSDQSDNIMERALNAWDKCKCARKCKRQLAAHEIINHQLQMLSLTREQRDIVLMGQLSVSRPCTASSGCAKPARKDEKKKHVCTRYFFRGKDVCGDMFVFMNWISYRKLDRLEKLIKEHGLARGVIMMRKPAAARSEIFSPDDRRNAVCFITNYAEESAVLLPGHMPRCKTSGIHLLPSSVSEISLYKLYQAASIQNGRHL
ncbi:uncharacterized protein [Diadema antillarum]|uniref:uncharacterized protein n=1 Tax=Diadema antillarum TaxID=105358 RepID=UPI003A8C38E1